jgi:hypothetical protein
LTIRVSKLFDPSFSCSAKSTSFEVRLLAIPDKNRAVPAAFFFGSYGETNLGTENFVFFGCGGVLSSFFGAGGVEDCGVEAWGLGDGGEAWGLGDGGGVGFDGGGDGG